MNKINKQLNVFKDIKAFKVLLDNESFEKYNMSEKFLKLYEELDDTILSLSSLNKIRTKQKDIMCSFIRNNKEYLNDILDIRSYFFNVIYALEKIFNSKIKKRQFVLYKDKKNKIPHKHSLRIGDLTFFDIDSKQVMKEFKEHFSLDFKDNSCGIKQVNHILKHSDEAILWRKD